MLGKSLIRGFCIAVLMPAGTGDVRLADAAMQGDKDAVRSLLKQKADVNAAQGDGMTALHWAAFKDDLEMTQMLLRAGANVKAATRDAALTPLSMACTNGNAAMIEALLKAGAEANSATAVGGATSLMLAAKSGSADAVKVLLDHGADVNAREAAHGQTALMFAAADNRAAVIKVLTARGADTKITTNVVKLEASRLDDNGNPIPARAAEGGGDSTVTGGNTVMGGMTALLFAAREGHLEAVRALLEAGADVNQVSAGEHSSPLVIAISNSHYGVGKYLVEHGANPNLANVDGLAPLYATIDMQYAPVSWAPNPLTVQEKVSHLELMKTLLEHGANPNAKLIRKLWFRPTSHNQQWISTVGTTPFWRAAQATDVPAMKLLVAGGVDPKIASAAGTTPLMVAAGLGFAGNFSQKAPDSWMPAVQYCLELGLDVNAQDAQGYTALHGAAYRGDDELIKFLVEKGARLDTRNKRGWSVTDMANGPSLRSSVPLAHPETVAFLIKMGAPELTPVQGETILGSTRRVRAAPAATGDELEHQTWMKTTSATAGILKKSVEAKQGLETAGNAQKLADVFEQVQVYWAKSNTGDAVSLAKTAHDASLELAASANAGNWAQAATALKAINGTCTACHSVHREKLPEGGYKIKP